VAQPREGEELRYHHGRDAEDHADTHRSREGALAGVPGELDPGDGAGRTELLIAAIPTAAIPTAATVVTVASTVQPDTRPRRTATEPPATSPPRNRGRLAQMNRIEVFAPARVTAAGCPWGAKAPAETDCEPAVVMAGTTVTTACSPATAASAATATLSGAIETAAITTAVTNCSAGRSDPRAGNAVGSRS
jgi:hypothetical protein